MTIRRFYVEPKQFFHNIISIVGEEHNHLKNVLRTNVGAEIIVTCNNEYDYHAVVTKISKNETLCNITKKTKNQYNPSVFVTVFQALTKRDAMSNLVQQLSELGVSEFVPLINQNITAKDKAGKLDKLQTVANQSTKQCKRSLALVVKPTMQFAELLQQVREYDLVVFANELEQSQHFSEVLQGAKQPKRVAIVVGSEGGFTEQEANALIEMGAKSIRLGNRILRVQTACVATTSVVMNFLNELN